jgi:hypothetical protein
MGTSVTPTVRDLRRLWKPTKQRLAKESPGHPTPIRFHRACSWLERADSFVAAAEPDLALVCQWIAFNSLYGQWDSDRREPKPDGTCWRQFLSRAVALDQSKRLPVALQEHRELVISILDDQYLSDYFWAEPGAHRAKQSKKSKFNARTWYLEGRWSLLLERVVERIHLMRCQLVHGAATHGSRLNRASLEKCCNMLGHLMPVVLSIIACEGAEEDWGHMCYPPIGDVVREHGLQTSTSVPDVV